MALTGLEYDCACKIIRELNEELKAKGFYFEGVQDLLNEIEQRVFGNDNEEYMETLK